MKVYIPNSAFLGNINGFLSKIDFNEPDVLVLEMHPKWMSIHPLVLSIIGAIGKTVSSENIECGHVLAPSGHYLKRMGLFDFIGVYPEIKEITEHESAGRFIPLRQITNSKDLDIFLKELVPLLHLEKESKHVQTIQHIFSELIRNVLEHSQSECGAIVCAQYFKKSNKISIGVVDNGIGLKKAISESYQVKDHVDSIKLALTPGVTGTTSRPGGTPQNAGFGLFLIKSIAYLGKNYFTILSGDKMYKLLQRQGKNLKLSGDPFNDRHSLSEIPSWNGVAVGVDITLDETLEFKSLIETIYNFYSKEVRGQKKAIHKKPKFI